MRMVIFTMLPCDFGCLDNIDTMSQLLMKALCRSYLKEAQCFNEDYIPSVEEHMELALVTCTYPMLLTDIVIKETFEWMFKGPKILTASTTISRCMDDIVGQKIIALDIYRTD